MFSLVERWRLALLRARIARGAHRDDTSTPALNRLRFYRWLYLTDQLSDSLPAAPAMDEAPALVDSDDRRGSP